MQAKLVRNKVKVLAVQRNLYTAEKNLSTKEP